MRRFLSLWWLTVSIGSAGVVGAFIWLISAFASARVAEGILLTSQSAADLGAIVLQGDDRSIFIPVRNPRQTTLIVREIKTSCGCAEATISPTTILAGKNAVINVRLSGATRGPKQLGLWLHTESGDVLNLLLSGVFINDYRWEPERFAFGRVTHGQEPVIQGLVEIVAGNELEVPTATVHPAHCAEVVAVELATVRWVGEKSVRQYRVAVRLKGSTENSISGFATVQLRDADQKELATTTLTWSRPKPLEVVPARIAFVGDPDQQRKLFVVCSDGREFSIESLKCNEEWLRIEASPGPAARHEVLLSNREVERSEGSRKLAAELVLLTDHPEMRELKVSIAWTP